MSLWLSLQKYVKYFRTTSVLSIFCIHKTKLWNLDTGFSKGVNCHCTNCCSWALFIPVSNCTPEVSVGLRGRLAGLVLNGKSKSLFPDHMVLTTIYLFTSENIKAN